MNKKKLTKLQFKNMLSNYLVYFVSIFTILVGCYVSISLFVFEQFNIHFYYLLVIALVAAVESIGIQLFIRINKISELAQSVVLYAFNAITCLLLVSLIDKNILGYPKFWIFSFPGSFIGLFFLMLGVYIIKRREEKKLNDSLDTFKNTKNKKNKITRVIVFILMMLTCTFTLSNSVVHATSDTNDFKHFSFIVNSSAKNLKHVWEVELNFETEKEIKYLDVLMKLENGHTESVYVSGRENLSTFKVTEVEGGFENELIFIINSNDNLQSIELVFNYSYVEEMPDEEDIIEKICFLSTGNTYIHEELSFVSCLLIGVIISALSTISTFIIIQNIKSSFIKVNEDVEESSNESPELE